MHDELCVLCGIRGVCGPLWLFPDVAPRRRRRGGDDSDDLDFITVRINKLAQEVLDSRLVELDLPEITSILRDAVVALREVPVNKETGYHLPVESMDSGYEHDVLAIGHFYAAGQYTPVVVDGRLRHPTGDDVEIRRVRDDMNGIFWYRVHGDQEHGTRVLDDTEQTHCESYNDTSKYNFFVHIPCFEYLRSWLRCQAPSRMGQRGEPLALAGELYEVVNSRTRPRGTPIAPAISYLLMRILQPSSRAHSNV